MQDLPPDIWALIADHIPLQELDELLSVNRAFFDLALDARYRTVEWAILDNKLIRMLDRLQDPGVASRVRRLHIRPWFIQYLFERELLFHTSSQLQEERKKTVTWNDAFAQITNYFYPPEVHSTHDGPPPPPHGFTAYPSAQELVRSMTKAIQGMTNVTEYEFQWRDMSVNPQTLSLLSSTRDAFHSNLSTLALQCRISMFDQIMSFTDFCGLTALALQFDYDPSTESKIGSANTATLVNSVARFVNHLKPTLHCLTIASHGRGDHSAFLRVLGPFPTLKSLTLRIPASAEYLPDPSAVTDLLLRHRCYLTRVVVRPECDKGHIQALSSWPAVSAPCMANTSWLDNLESLTFPALHQATVLTLIRRTPAHLTSLSLFGRFLKEDDVLTVASTLGDRTNLQSLALDIKEMTSDLFTLLANTLPGLRSLTVVLESSPDSYNMYHFREKQYVRQTEWQLYDLAIHHRCQKDDSVHTPGMDAEYGLMRRLTSFVLPNVRSFKGRGNKLPRWNT
ncbi:hypothetical protein DXG01_011458 [Tephrocybe rancida]|nr:hypothetical protein DXG01_011458 [Tephrocybe rancida]